MKCKRFLKILGSIGLVVVLILLISRIPPLTSAPDITRFGQILEIVAAALIVIVLIVAYIVGKGYRSGEKRFKKKVFPPFYWERRA
ncbi:hypothetical protein ES708_20134 [subsurface metagenome]